MSHLLAFMLCLAGFAALAFAMRRHQRDVLGGPLPPPKTYALRVAGGAALLSALGILVTQQGWSLGLVSFSGHASITAGIVYCALAGYMRIRAGALGVYPPERKT
ncbi:DUF3325 domain-containing protein [Bradyrhizobium sp. LHD-71]|uniref:DUF3325 domain-containing protein n=1 Tax=Bradyrhizobium sp. LHD-71 TaxID=3072141 RepID=UPI00280D414F|nr:DUF3325 domain-containing protein [Bradyrhizobium sp. LHD-71]MDQ8730072.1 DUF3325 domain-containing protein [Bradyrhizobium sp. LHD-71]